MCTPRPSCAPRTASTEDPVGARQGSRVPFVGGMAHHRKRCPRTRHRGRSADAEGHWRKTMKRPLLACSIAVVSLLLSSQAALAGEWNPANGDTAAKTHGGSNCLFNGRDQPDESGARRGRWRADLVRREREQCGRRRRDLRRRRPVGYRPLRRQGAVVWADRGVRWQGVRPLARRGVQSDQRLRGVAATARQATSPSRVTGRGSFVRRATGEPGGIRTHNLVIKSHLLCR